MTQRRGHPRFFELLDKLAHTHERKNSDYATGADPFSNFRECEKFGVPAYLGALVRMSDKWARITNLIASGKDPAVSEETVTDTLEDLAVYCLIEIILLEEHKARNPVNVDLRIDSTVFDEALRKAQQTVEQLQRERRVDPADLRVPMGAVPGGAVTEPIRHIDRFQLDHVAWTPQGAAIGGTIEESHEDKALHSRNESFCFLCGISPPPGETHTHEDPQTSEAKQAKQCPHCMQFHFLDAPHTCKMQRDPMGWRGSTP